MFRNPKRSSQDTLLPHSGNGRGGGGGLYGTARMTPKASLSKSFIATIIWALVSLCLIGGGWQYCSRNMESTSVKCDMRSCDVTELKSGVLTKLTIPHSLMVRAELVRLKNGQIVDPASLRRSAQRKLGHTYSLVYMEADSEEDDDDSYDSFEDDDDSYDSYDDDDPSSDEGDDDEDDDLPRSRKQAKPTPAGKKAPAPVKREPADPAAAERAARARKVALERKEAQKRMWAEERAAKGLPPIKEPDEQEASQAAARKGGARAARINRDDDGDDERFPGDAGTLREKNLAEIRRMEASQGMAAEGHRDRSQRAYEEAAKKHQARAQIDAQMKQRGNNLHDRGTTPPNRNRPPAKENLSPDDPDSPDPARDRARPPKLERQNFEPDLKVENEEGGDAEMKQGGGRKLSSVEGSEEDADAALEEHQRVLTQAKDQVLAEAKGGRGKQGEGFETLGDFVQAGAAGARRKLLGWKQDRMKNVKPATAKPSKEEVAKDAAKARDSHRKGHGHHQKRARKFARPVPTADDDDEQELKAQLDARNKKHHHKAFHHKKEVPQAERHHVHHRFHHQPGQEKIDHGWRHQNRQWHGHREQKKLGTTYSLGRKMARKRKEIIDSYVSRRTTTVDFTDSKKWRAGGLWLIILGCISTAFCIVVGNFQPRPKTKKVS